MPHNSQSQFRSRSNTLFGWMRPRHHHNENDQSVRRGEAQHQQSIEDDRSERQGDAPERSVPRERYPPPSYEWATNADQVSISISQDRSTPPTANMIPPVCATPPTSTDPPAFNDELPPPSYEDANCRSPRWGQTRQCQHIHNQHPERRSEFQERTRPDRDDQSQFRRRHPHHKTQRSQRIDSAQHLNHRQQFRWHPGWRSLKGCVTMGNGSISTHSQRTDDRGNTFTHSFSSINGRSLQIGNISITGGGNANTARTVTASNSSRRPRSSSQYGSAQSSDRIEDGSSDESSDSDSDNDRWYGRTTRS